ncbi:hypothetical protein B0T13DRAFT_504233 [Neurospora crassa]|nr:hypothetical protein B0T13DRAFT_504233 [Neurospora crassa]
MYPQNPTVDGACVTSLGGIQREASPTSTPSPLDPSRDLHLSALPHESQSIIYERTAKPPEKARAKGRKPLPQFRSPSSGTKVSGTNNHRTLYVRTAIHSLPNPSCHSLLAVFHQIKARHRQPQTANSGAIVSTLRTGSYRRPFLCFGLFHMKPYEVPSQAVSYVEVCTQAKTEMQLGGWVTELSNRDRGRRWHGCTYRTVPFMLCSSRHCCIPLRLKGI